MHKYELKRKKNCSRIILRVVGGQVKVVAPMTVSKWQIDQFIEQKTNWIDTQLVEQQSESILEQSSLLLFGKIYQTNFIYNSPKYIKIQVDTTTINFFIPKSSTSEQVTKAYKRFLTKQAMQYFTYCLAELSKRRDVLAITSKYLRKWRVRFLKSAFGLCYAQRGEIVLNVELVQYDKSFIDYVILHEISHFLYQDHSKNFYQIFEKLEPNWKKYKKELQGLHQKYGGWSYK